MATAQVVSATTALHDEKIEEQPIKKTDQDDIKNTVEDEEATPPAPAPQEDQLPKEAVDSTIVPEPEVVAPGPEPEAEAKPESEPEPEPEELAGEVETKVVVKEEEEEEEGKVNPVDQPAKVAPEPCVEEETKEPETKPVETEVAKAEPEEKADDQKEEEDEGVAAEE